MNKPVLLDLFCGAGGAAWGYHLAGFQVVGVDHQPQPHYPFAFIQDDAFNWLAYAGHTYDAIHASPPCQAYSKLAKMTKKTYEQLIEPTRQALNALGKPYIIENVVGAPLQNPVRLCGSQFGLKVYRHRLFESNKLLMGLSHQPHHDQTPKGGTRGNNLSPKGFICVAGHFSNVDYARQAMGIDWMNRDELAQAIPPAFTHFLGKQLIRYVETKYE